MLGRAVVVVNGKKKMNSGFAKLELHRAKRGGDVFHRFKYARRYKFKRGGSARHNILSSGFKGHIAHAGFIKMAEGNESIFVQP